MLYVGRVAGILHCEKGAHVRPHPVVCDNLRQIKLRLWCGQLRRGLGRSWLFLQLALLSFALLLLLLLRLGRLTPILRSRFTASVWYNILGWRLRREVNIHFEVA